MAKKNPVQKFKDTLKQVRGMHEEFEALVKRAQESVPYAVNSISGIYRLMTRMKEAGELSAQIGTMTIRAFEKLEKVPHQEQYKLVRKHLSMGIIQAHNLTRHRPVMDVFVEIKRWMSKNKKLARSTRKAAQDEIDKSVKKKK